MTSYLIRNERNLILGSNGEWQHEMFIGPNQNAPKLWKSEAGAKRALAATGRTGRVEKVGA